MSKESQNERPVVEPLWVTDDVAAYLGVSKSTARRYVEQHGLPFIRLPRGVRYEPAAVRQWARDLGVQKTEADEKWTDEAFEIPADRMRRA